MKTITYPKLVSMLANVDHALPVTFEATTKPAMRRTNNPFYGKITKIARINGFIGASYQNSVNRQLKREKNRKAGAFKAEKLGYGQHVTKAVIEYSGKYYLQVKTERNSMLSSKYKFGGKFIPETKIKRFLLNYTTSRNQRKTNIKKFVVVKNYLLTNIKSINLNGVKYRIPPTKVTSLLGENL